MAHEVIKKKRFLNKLTKVLAFLHSEWGAIVASNFLERTDRKIELIRQHPQIGLPSGIRNTRSILITKHNRLFYKIAGNKIIILNLYDTRKKSGNA